MTKARYVERVEKALCGPEKPQTIIKLAEQLEFHQSTVSLALRQLVQDGKATKNRQGFYRRQMVRFF